VIVISRNAYPQSTTDMLVVAMTSNPAPVLYSFTITNADMVLGQLNRPGQVRVDKIYTLAQTLAVRHFGRVSPTIIERIRAFLQDLTEIQPT
jgi:mRNA interferase MazF